MAEIIIVDDDPEVREMLADALTASGHAVRAAGDGEGLRAFLAAGPAALVVLDLSLPGEDGLRLARWLREHHRLGIVMLTGAGGLLDRVVGLEIGADDYLAKPCSMAELRARIEAVLRRRQPAAEDLPEGVLRFGPYRFDTRHFLLVDRQGREVPLAPMELDLVAAFALNPGRALSREDLLRLAPPRDDDSFDRSIDHRITRLRRKLETDPARPALIKTLRGAGYIHPG